MKDQNAFIALFKKVLRIEDDRVVQSKIAKALGLSESGTYKKIRGISKFTIDDAFKIMQYYDVIFELNAKHKNEYHHTYDFFCDDLVKPPSSFEQWAANILNYSLTLDKYRSAYELYSFQNKLSYFNFIDFAHLTYFKLFSWNRTSWKFSSTRNYDHQEFARNTSLNLLLSEVKEHYLSYRSTDIWHVDLLDSTFAQIRYYQQLELFKTQDDLILIIKDLKNLIQTMHAMATDGKKMRFGSKVKGENIDIFLNSVHSSSNFIFIKAKDFRITYESFLEPNYLRTSDKHVCDYTEKWIERAMAQSILISNSGEVKREDFFKELNIKFNHFVEALNVEI